MGGKRIGVVGIIVMVLAMIGIAEAQTPPGIANNPSHARCLDKNYKTCYNLVHVCPKFCPNGCTVNCVSCKPVCSPSPPTTTPPPPTTPSTPTPPPPTPTPSPPPPSTPSPPTTAPPTPTPSTPSPSPPTPSSPSPPTPSPSTPSGNPPPYSPPTPTPPSPSPSTPTPSSPSPPTPSPPTPSGNPPPYSPPTPTPSPPSPSTPTPSSPSPPTPSPPTPSGNPPPYSPPTPTPSPPSPSTPTPSSPSPPTPSPPTPSGNPPPYSPPTPTPSPPSPSTPTPSSPSPPTPSPSTPSGNPPPSMGAKCRNKSYPQCYNTEHVCPSSCPGGCEVDCVTCKPVCNCDTPGAVCQDPRFIGGDGITFYFHGKKDKDFCLVSDPNLHINAHFIGKRNRKMSRDFTWVQSTAILFDKHQLFLAALQTSTWDDSVDRLALSFDGEPITLPEYEGSVWQSKSVTITRTTHTNNVVVEVEGKLKITARVVPITEQDSRIHNYGITKDDCFAHLDLGFKFYSLSDEVNGVLGQTYRAGYVSRVNVGAKMPVLGGNAEFQTSSLFAADCAVARFNGFQTEGSLQDFEFPELSCASGIDGQGVVCKR